MNVKLDPFNKILEYLQINGKDTPTIAQNMRQSVKTPILEYHFSDFWKKDLWKDHSMWLDSKVFCITGGPNREGLPEFKEDHNPDLTMILNDGQVGSDGALHFKDKKVYDASKGTPFVYIPRKRIYGAKTEYAIKDGVNYQKINKDLVNGKLDVKALEDAGGFKVNDSLLPSEVVLIGKNGTIERVHSGWLEHGVGKNNATDDEYRMAKYGVFEYRDMAIQKGRFNEKGKGMGWFVDVDTDPNRLFRARVWCLGISSNGSSSASFWHNLNWDDNGQFLLYK